MVKFNIRRRKIAIVAKDIAWVLGLYGIFIFIVIPYGPELLAFAWPEFDGFYANYEAEFGVDLLRQARDFVTLAFLVLLALAIVGWKLYVHPVIEPGYAAWLRTTPWCRGMKLPLGSPLPDWSDLAWVAVFVSVFAYVTALPWWLGVAIFAGGYSLAMLYPMFRTRQEWLGYAVAMLGVVALTVDMPLWAYAMLACAAFLIALFGVWRGLGGLQNAVGETREDEPSPRPVMSSPVEPINPREHIAWSHALAISLAFAWLVWASINHEADRRALFIIPLLIAKMGVLRLLIYIARHHCPVPLLRRLRHGPLYIRGYDQVFLTPLLMLLACAPMPMVLFRMGAPLTAACALPFGFAVLLMLKGPPGTRAWTLTGNHRLPLKRPEFIGDTPGKGDPSAREKLVIR